jgi:hypothetical protein
MDINSLQYPWQKETQELKEKIEQLEGIIVLLQNQITALQNKEIQYQYSTTSDSTQIVLPALGNAIVKYSGGTGNGC